MVCRWRAATEMTLLLFAVVQLSFPSNDERNRARATQRVLARVVVVVFVRRVHLLRSGVTTASVALALATTNGNSSSAVIGMPSKRPDAPASQKAPRGLASRAT